MPAHPSSFSSGRRAGLWIAVFLLAGLLLAMPPLDGTMAQDFPALSGRVVDEASLLYEEEEEELSQSLAAHETRTGNQIVVVTVEDLQGYPIEDFTIGLARQWGIGQKGKDNGIVFLVAWLDREMRIEVGYGLEGDLPDAMASRIIEEIIVPHFKDGRYSVGIMSGTDAIVTVLEGGQLDTVAARQQPQAQFGLYWDLAQEQAIPYWATFILLSVFDGPFWLIIAAFVVGLGGLLAYARKREEPIWRLLRALDKKMERSRGSGGRSSSRGGWSSSSSGRSSFGGGGGSFGGGGASGRW